MNDLEDLIKQARYDLDVAQEELRKGLDKHASGEISTKGNSMPEEPTEVSRIRVGMGMKWAPMLGYNVPDHNTGVDLVLMSDGSLRWEDINNGD